MNMPITKKVNYAIIGAGLAGLSTAYYLKKYHKSASIAIIDLRAITSYTSSQSGNNYRNWWPHPVMTAFTDQSISLMEKISQHSNNYIEMNRRGYCVISRHNSNVEQLLDKLNKGYQNTETEIRVHSKSSSNYQSPYSANWQTSPTGIDLITDQQLIKNTFPSYSESVSQVMHIRRAGDINGQSLGQYLWSEVSDAGVSLVNAEVKNIQKSNDYRIELHGSQGVEFIDSEVIVNCAGPFANDIALMLGNTLPFKNVYQQKVAFEDSKNTIPRDLPFTIDVDDANLGWSAEEITELKADSKLSWLTNKLHGGIHCRPEGGDNGNWVKLGWAYQTETSAPLQHLDLHEYKDLNPLFPELVIRAASRLQPALATYIEKGPSRRIHYGGFYTMTEENWPLIGPTSSDSFVVGALSGFGTMGCCAAGELCAQWIVNKPRADYAKALSPYRYSNQGYFDSLQIGDDLGLL